MSHPTNEKLARWLEGMLRPAEASFLESHLENCTECEAFVTQLEQASGSMESLVRAAIQQHDSGKERTLESSHPLPTLGQYRCTGLLGSGGMGAVYAAIHLKLDKLVALKVLPHDKMSRAGMVERFEREMRAVGKLDHANIVRAMDAGEHQGTHFLVMELVDGATVSEALDANGPLPVADACEIIRQACLGLDEAHHHGMVHRDIKPSNLMLSRVRNGQPQVKVLDLGLALLGEGDSGGITGSGQVMGTIDYMSPEQCDDSHRVDIRADIYSLGATLYALLVGQAPFASESSSLLQRLLSVTQEPPPPIREKRPEVLETLAHLIHQMLAKSREDRPADPLTISQQLAPFCEGHNLNELLAAVPPRRLIAAESTDGSPVDETVHEHQDSKKEGVNERFASRLGWIAGCSCLLLLTALGIYLTRTPTGGLILLDIRDPEISISINGQAIAVADGVDRFTIEEDGNHELLICHQGLELRATDFRLTRGKKTRLRVTLSNGELIAFRDDLEVGRVSRVPDAHVPITGDSPDSKDMALAFNLGTSPDEPLPYVTVPSLQDTTESMTLELWTQRSSRDPVRAHEFVLGMGSIQNISSFPQGFEFRYDRNVSLNAKDNNLSLTQPIHLAAVRDAENTEIRFYHNGHCHHRYRYVKEAPIRYAEDCLEFCSRRWQWNDGSVIRYSGWIDEVRVSSVARYDADFVPQKRFDVDETTRALYHCDEGTGNLLHDASPNKHDGRIHGAHWLAMAGKPSYQLQRGSPSVDADKVPSAASQPEYVKDAVPHVVQPLSGSYALAILPDAPGKQAVVINSLRDESPSLTMECWLHRHPHRIHAHSYVLGFEHVRFKSGEMGNLIGAMHRTVIGGENPLAGINGWTHVAIVRDHSVNEIRFYQDGTLVQRQAVEGPTEGVFEICSPERQWGVAKYGNQAPYYYGWIDEIRVSNTARYEGDFQPQERFDTDTETVALYHCDEGAGNQLVDVSGNEHHGQLTGSMQWLDESGWNQWKSSNPANAHDSIAMPQRSDWRIENFLAWVLQQPLVELHVDGRRLESGDAVPQNPVRLTFLSMRACTPQSLRRVASAAPHMIHLEKLYVNGIQDWFCPCLSQMPNLSWLTLGDNTHQDLTDAGILQIGDLYQLRFLDLAGNVGRMGLSHIAKVAPNLDTLLIHSESATGAALNALGEVEHLRALSLNGYGSDRESLLALSQLNIKDLTLRGMQSLEPKSLESLSQMPLLREIHILACRSFTDEHLLKLTQFPQLRVLQYYDGRITPEGVLTFIKQRPDIMIGVEESQHDLLQLNIPQVKRYPFR